MTIRTATMNDLNAITAVEAECFPAAEAASREEFSKRLTYYNDHFWLMFDEDKLIAFVDGFVTDEELIALYSTCKVFCFLSLYEGFGIPPLEALSCGANVVVSNTSSLPEVVGDVGITVDPMNEDDVIDGIKRSIYQNKEKYMEEVTEHLKKYDWKNLSKEFENVFDC